MKELENVRDPITIEENKLSSSHQKNSSPQFDNKFH